MATVLNAAEKAAVAGRFAELAASWYVGWPMLLLLGLKRPASA